MSKPTPTETSLRLQIAAHKSWAKTPDRTARTANGRKTFLDSFELEVDPDRIMSPGDRAKAARNARTAHFKGLALKSAEARRRRSARGAGGDHA